MQKLEPKPPDENFSLNDWEDYLRELEKFGVNTTVFSIPPQIIKKIEKKRGVER